MNKLHKCWVISRNPFRESSVILDLITDSNQRISVLMKGAKKNKFSSILQPFNMLYISWSGKTELKTLTYCEPSKHYNFLGKKLYCAFYLNELISRTLIKGQILDGISNLYENTIIELNNQCSTDIEPVLRKFELNLLFLAGYLATLDYDAVSHKRIENDKLYIYIQETGLVSYNENSLKLYNNIVASAAFSGNIWQKLVQQDFTDKKNYSAYKYIMRFLLKPIIGEKILNSTKFFKATKKLTEFTSKI